MMSNFEGSVDIKNVYKITNILRYANLLVLL